MHLFACMLPTLVPFGSACLFSSHLCHSVFLARLHAIVDSITSKCSHCVLSLQSLYRLLDQDTTLPPRTTCCREGARAQFLNAVAIVKILYFCVRYYGTFTRSGHGYLGPPLPLVVIVLDISLRPINSDLCDGGPADVYWRRLTKVRQ